VRGNHPIDPDWFAGVATPGWQQRSLENFAANQAGGAADQDLVQDGWTDIARRIRAFNHPNTRLVDTDDQGVSRITPAGVVATPAGPAPTSPTSTPGARPARSTAWNSGSGGWSGRMFIDRDQARQELSRLERSTTLSAANIPAGGTSAVSGPGFLPRHPVTLAIDGTPVARVAASGQGTVSYVLNPAALGLAPGHHVLTLRGMLITTTAGFNSLASSRLPRG